MPSIIETMLEAVAAPTPFNGAEAVDFYRRTFVTLLKSSGDIPLRTLFAAHAAAAPMIHPHADDPERVDLGAFSYAMARLPVEILDTRQIVLAQLPSQFAADGHPVDSWRRVQAIARRRHWRFDDQQTLAVYLASASDIDDLIPTLVAFALEYNKIHTLLRSSAANTRAEERGAALRDGFDRIFGERGPDLLDRIARRPLDIQVRLIGGTHIAYSQVVRRWWEPIQERLSALDFERRPVYVVSSNLHGLPNLLDGAVARHADDLRSSGNFTENSDDDGTAINALYYAARAYFQDPERHTQREREAVLRGIYTVPAQDGLDVGVQIIDLSRLQTADLDPRLGEWADQFRDSQALILNLDYPLGLAAYGVLRYIAESVPSIRGVYIVGKAASLNGEVGDVLIPNLVFDEHSGCVINFPNCFTHESVAPYLRHAAVLDNQRALTVRSTFLQNREYLNIFFRDNYSIVEMEAAPYLSAIYEATHPSRYPTREHVQLSRLPFDFGILHYASDTPYRGFTLATQRLAQVGVEAVYASMIAVLRQIARSEARARWPEALLR